MAKKLVCVALLLTWAATTAHAQTVTLRACNPGTADVDVYFSQGTNVVARHVAPADCAELASSKGAMTPGFVAVGFTDTQGRWGGVHRYERLPTFWNGVAESATQTLSVMHGATRVSIPAQFRFQPPTPVCVQYRRETSTGIFEVGTRCDDFIVNVNVLAFPDTREVVFQRFCPSCDDKVEAQKSPEQRVREKQADDLARAVVKSMRPLPSDSDFAASVGVGARIAVEANSAKEESNDRYLEMLEHDPTKWDRIGWNDVPRYSREVSSNAAMKGSVAVLQGTITGMQRHNASDPWYDVFFQESPDHKFILCTKDLDVLADVFGANYSTAMIGKKIEVQGLAVQCLGAPGIFVKLQHQIKFVGTGFGMVTAVTPPAFKYPEDPDKRVLPILPAPGGATYDANQLAFAHQRLERQCTALYTPPTVLGLSTTQNIEPDPTLVKTDIAACIARFDLAKLVPLEQTAMRYCITRNNYNAARPYTDEHDRVWRAFNTCMAQNDPVIIPCEESRRSSPRPPVDDSCVPMPSTDEAAAMLRGDAGPIPSAPPGLPAIQLPPATAKAAVAAAVAKAGATSSAGAQTTTPSAPAPAPAPPQAGAAPGSTPANTALERTMKTQACAAEAMRKLGPSAISSNPAGFQKAVQECLQR